MDKVFFAICVVFFILCVYVRIKLDIAQHELKKKIAKGRILKQQCAALIKESEDAKETTI